MPSLVPPVLNNECDCESELESSTDCTNDNITEGVAAGSKREHECIG